MKCTIPEISWHNREPVLSVDIHPISSEFYKLASGGGDSHVLIWQMTITENGAVKQEVVSDLTRHQRAVNCVRWSPEGKFLASADDDAYIIVWQLKTDNVPLLEGDNENKETWVVHKVLRGHKEDIYDLSWSIDGSKLFSGSVDNTAILWDLAKGKMEHILTDHKGFVQGVSWDPKKQFLSSLSTDRICRLFDISGKHVKARIQKGTVPVPSNHFLSGKEVKYFHDDTFKSFFRRLEFSPDGSLLVVPSGRMEAEDCKKVLCATLMFAIDNYNLPCAVLPLPNQCSTVVRFCPILFNLREDGPEPVVKLPYRMVFAVGTDHDIILYDTQQKEPFARFHQIHYTRVTDLTWSQDGLLLTASSTDGFCALVTFDVGELGTPYVKEDSCCSEAASKTSIISSSQDAKPIEVRKMPRDQATQQAKTIEVRKQPRCDMNPINDAANGETPVEGQEKVEVKEQIITAVEKKRSSFLEQWALKTPPKKTQKQKVDPEQVIAILDEENDEAMAEGKAEELSQEIKDQIHKLIPSKADSKTTISSSQGAKPIEVRKRPRDAATQEAKPLEVRNQPGCDTDSIIDVTNGETPVENQEKVEVKEQISTAIEKKRPSLMEKWALKTPKRTQDQKVDPEQVIAILDEENDEAMNEGETEELSQEIKDQIHQLIPSKAASKTTISSSQGAKPIEVRKKPRDAATQEAKPLEVRNQPGCDTDSIIDVTNGETPVENQEKVEVKEQISSANEKKRPSLLEKWAWKTPPKKALKQKVDPKEVIEILDEENDEAMDKGETKALSQEIKDQIHQLIPSKAASKTTISASQGAEPIEVRKKPRDKATQKAKPIEVRKKPRCNTDSKNDIKNGETPVEAQGKVEVKEQISTAVEKKRPSFLEKWALKTPPKKAKKQNVDREEVIEILDKENNEVTVEAETEELSQEIKDQIHQLIPSKAASKTTISASQAAKPIEVRKRPRDEATKEAKPIEVRRKPRCDTDSKNDVTNGETSKKSFSVT
ncbi:unnamed protein product [Acanthoscelides obtectus]|uniref:CAF1B/HIR1 beta-propeller domain-containing protein n=1 Tax=Acanthoscelides obtectus TaxID=200917 RepID=A0A9P0PVM1_ACAOB|nr:unnamed protein product [Acanthoscelides obtectus]CAK1660851.1 Chromatin assembly factor 1 subunit B [Acanthoscelides obtectus]